MTPQEKLVKRKLSIPELGVHGLYPLFFLFNAH